MGLDDQSKMLALIARPLLDNLHIVTEHRLGRQVRVEMCAATGCGVTPAEPSSTLVHTMNPSGFYIVSSTLKIGTTAVDLDIDLTPGSSSNSAGPSASLSGRESQPAERKIER
jgi:hypothetical protein